MSNEGLETGQPTIRRSRVDVHGIATLAEEGAARDLGVFTEAQTPKSSVVLVGGQHELREAIGQ